MTIENVNVHHFGQDGLVALDNLIDPSLIPATIFNRIMNLTVINSKFDWNGRIGFYWGGGRFVNAINCEFNNNAITRFGSKAADGLDYEYFGGNPMENGNFEYCDFLFNAAYGIEVYASNQNLAVNQTYRNCNFAASEGTYSATPNGKNFTFRGCNFFGPVTHAYNDRVRFGSNHINNAKFIGCRFAEELNGFSFNMDSLDNCPTVLNWGDKSWLVDFSTGAAGAFFNHCTFESNKEMKLLNIEGGPDTLDTTNFVRMLGCDLTNHFVNSNDLGRVYSVDVQQCRLNVPHGGLEIYRSGWPDTFFIKVVDPSLAQLCVPKYTVPAYPDSVQDAFTCDSCPTIYLPAFCPATIPGCSPCPRYHENKVAVTENSVRLFPNPTNSKITIEGILENEDIVFYDLYGKRLYYRKAISFTEEFDLSTFSSGVYLISVGNRHKLKLLKN